MRKRNKVFLSISLLTTSIVPITLLTTSCTNNKTINMNQQILHYDIEFNDLSVYLNNISSDTLVESLKNNDYNILYNMCTFLNIHLNEKDKLATKDVVFKNNQLTFILEIGVKPNIKKYQITINNMDPNLNNNFINHPEENQIIKNPELTTAQTFTILNKYEPILEQVKITNPNIKDSQNFDWTTNSETVKTFVKNLIINKEYDNPTNTISYFIDDLQMELKTFISNTILEWNNNIISLYKSKVFTSVFANGQYNNLNGGFAIQFYNITPKTQSFNFLGETINLKTNERFTANVEFSQLDLANSFYISPSKTIGIKIPNVIAQYQINNSEPKALSNSTSVSIEKSIRINTQIDNVEFIKNTVYDTTLNTNISELISKHTFDLAKIKKNIEEQIKHQLDIKKQKTLATLEVIEKFLIPTSQKLKLEFDVDNNNIFSLLDLLCLLGDPIGKYLESDGSIDAAIVARNFLSPLPLYQAFYNCFESLIALLRRLNISAINEIVDFIEQSLSLNGKKKPLEDFKLFFKNISNLKTLVAQLLVNRYNFSAYTIQLICTLIDTLSDTKTNLLKWLSTNFSTILLVVNSVLPSNQQGIKDIIVQLQNLQISYNGQTINNITTDIPLYNFLTGENVVATNALNLGSLGSILDLAFPIIKGLFKEAPIGELFVFILNSLVNIVIDKDLDTVQNLTNYFKQFYIPQTVGGQPNTNNTTIYDLLNNDTSYIVKDFVWTDKNDGLINATLDTELNFNIQLPTFETITYKQKNNRPKINIASLNTKYSFNQINIKPIFNGNELNYGIPHFATTKGIGTNVLHLNEQKNYFGIFNINENLNANIQLTLPNFNDNVLKEDAKITIKKNLLNTITTTINLKKNDVLENNTLTKAGYESIIQQLNKLSTNLDFNSELLKPFIVIESKTKISIYFQTKILINEEKLGKITSFLDNKIELKLSIK